MKVDKNGQWLKYKFIINSWDGPKYGCIICDFFDLSKFRIYGRNLILLSLFLCWLSYHIITFTYIDVVFVVILWFYPLPNSWIIHFCIDMWYSKAGIFIRLSLYFAYVLSVGNIHYMTIYKTLIFIWLLLNVISPTCIFLRRVSAGWLDWRLSSQLRGQAAWSTRVYFREFYLCRAIAILSWYFIAAVVKGTLLYIFFQKIYDIFPEATSTIIPLGPAGTYMH